MAYLIFVTNLLLFANLFNELSNLFNLLKLTAKSSEILVKQLTVNPRSDKVNS